MILMRLKNNDFHTFVFLARFTTCLEFQLTCPFDFERVSAFHLNLFRLRLSGINQLYSIVWVYVDLDLKSKRKQILETYINQIVIYDNIIEILFYECIR